MLKARSGSAEAVEQAIDAFQTALDVSTRSNRPVYWVDVKESIAKAYRMRKRGVRADNLRLAETHVREALRDIDERHAPQTRVRLHAMLGTVLMDREQWQESVAAFAD